MWRPGIRSPRLAQTGDSPVPPTRAPWGSTVAYRPICGRRPEASRQRTMVTNFGYPLMTEQSGPCELVRYAAAAEDEGFDFESAAITASRGLTSMVHSPCGLSRVGWGRPGDRAGRANDLRSLPEDALSPRRDGA